ncbi:hypothetical protein BAUCODRAFT_196134 [Baudoinia panamericana UAMH 10762]|uniref:Uncharacterized protein n=1 Tax=Baudoinia panamericana (strain UAMH 10762) TaxID=717646 RepID=M2NQ19_BAUPA|nr:uncharacterized protein BAUCODRAFT_196134 [Baudoinia panamericana UAMH 10762]EMD01101.1 hypothetical protein BAUCODRAFT_196134 [Baudoinia panamericana UAMH 10762]
MSVRYLNRYWSTTFDLVVSAHKLGSKMSVQSPNFSTPPSDKNTPTQDRGLFHHEAQKHESHHYLRMYGGKVLDAAMWGFGATLGADVANEVFGDAKNQMQEWWRH